MPNSDDATARSVHVTSSSPNCPEWIHWMKKETLSRTEIFFFAMSIIVGKQFNAPFEGGLWVMITTMVLSGLLGGKMFWYSNTLLGMVSLVLILIYIFGSFPEADLNRWGAGEEFDFHNVLEGLPRASLSYLGIQVLSLTSKWAKDAKTDIPTVTPIAMIVMFFTAIGVTILGAANAPGIEGLAGESYPLTFGFSRIFKLSENQALWLSFPASNAMVKYNIRKGKNARIIPSVSSINTKKNINSSVDVCPDSSALEAPPSGSASLYDEERDLSHLPRLDKPSLYAIPDSSSRRSQSSTVPPARSLSEKIINYFNTAFSNITDNELAIYEDGGEFGDMSTRHVAYDRARFNDSDRNDSKT
eukprot:gene7707-8322_t